MRPGRILCLVAGAMIVAGARPLPDAALRSRQLMTNAVSHQNTGRNQLAIEELSQVVAWKALSPADLARALYDRGVAYDSLGDTRAAIGDYSAALVLDKRFAAAFNNRANAYRRLGRATEAKRDYLAALACPGGAREYAHYGLGQIAETRGDMGMARDEYHKALSANPSFAPAALGLVSLDQRTREAILAAAPAHPDVIVAAHAQPIATVPEQTVPDDPPPEKLKPVAAVTVPPKPVVAAPEQPKSVATAPERAKPVVTVPERAKPEAAARAAPVRVAEINPVLRHAIVDAGKRNAAAAQIQLGAFRDQEAANQAWSKIAASSGNALDGLSPLTIWVDLPGKGRFWRLRAAVSDGAEARRICKVLAAQGQACLVAHD